MLQRKKFVRKKLEKTLQKISELVAAALSINIRSYWMPYRVHVVFKIEFDKHQKSFVIHLEVNHFQETGMLEISIKFMKKNFSSFR